MLDFKAMYFSKYPQDTETETELTIPVSLFTVLEHWTGWKMLPKVFPKKVANYHV